MNYHLLDVFLSHFNEYTLRCVVNLWHKDANVALDRVNVLTSVFLGHCFGHQVWVQINTFVIAIAAILFNLGAGEVGVDFGRATKGDAGQIRICLSINDRLNARKNYTGSLIWVANEEAPYMPE